MPIERYAKVLEYVILRPWPTKEHNGKVVGALGYVIQSARLATGNPALACRLKRRGSRMYVLEYHTLEGFPDLSC